MILGLDLSTALQGWCAGDGTCVPTAGAFELFDRDHRGRLGCEMQAHMLRLHKRFGATHWVIERPLLLPTDLLWTLERLYGLAFLVHVLGEKLGVHCETVTVNDVKTELGGSGASKDDQVAAALRMGVRLPDHVTEGRRDAADAVGAWKIGIRRHAKQYLPRWDAALYSSRGALL